MLEINDLRVSVEGKQILKGLNLSVPAGEVHAIMGPNGAGKSTLAYALAGREGYEHEGGSAKLLGDSIIGLDPEDRAALGLFLAFQYPVEIPGVAGMTFLKTALNAMRVARGQEELSALDFLKLVRERLKSLGIDEAMLKRPVNVGFSGGEKNATKFYRWHCLSQNSVFSMKQIVVLISTLSKLWRKASMPSGLQNAAC